MNSLAYEVCSLAIRCGQEILFTASCGWPRNCASVTINGYSEKLAHRSRCTLKRKRQTTKMPENLHKVFRLTIIFGENDAVFFSRFFCFFCAQFGSCEL
jgi:hypothetical protein